MILGGCKKDTTDPINEGNKTIEDDDSIVETGEDTDEDKADTSKIKEYAMHMGTVEVEEELIYEDDFEGDSTLFTGRGAAKVEIVNKSKVERNHFMSAEEPLFGTVLP